MCALSYIRFMHVIYVLVGCSVVKWRVPSNPMIRKYWFIFRSSTLHYTVIINSWVFIECLIVRHADEIWVSGGGLKLTHTGNTRGPPGVWNCNPDDPSSDISPPPMKNSDPWSWIVIGPIIQIYRRIPCRCRYNLLTVCGWHCLMTLHYAYYQDLSSSQKQTLLTAVFHLSQVEYICKFSLPLNTLFLLFSWASNQNWVPLSNNESFGVLLLRP